MLTNSPPFRGKNRELIFESIKNRPLDFNRKGVKESLAALHDAGELAKDFLSRCMEKDHPEKRPTATELLQHEWVKLGAKDYDVDDVQRLNMGLDLYTARRNTSFQNCVMSFLIEVRSTKEDLKVLGDMFNSMDQNGDGYLRPKRLRIACSTVRMNLRTSLARSQIGTCSSRASARTTRGGSTSMNSSEQPQTDCTSSRQRRTCRWHSTTWTRTEMDT